MQYGIQLYTLRDIDATLPDTIELVGESGFDGIEFAGFAGEDTAHLAEVAAEAGLDVVGAHVSYDDLAADPAGTLAPYQTLGCGRIVIPSYDRDAFASAAAAREAGERIAELVEPVEEIGGRLCYHNHTFEFEPVDDETAFDAFVAAAEGVALEFDIGLANHGGVDPAAYLERYADRVELVHLTDSRPPDHDARHADLGTGTADLNRCLDVCEDADVAWAVFEHGLTDDPIGSMERAAAWIEENR